MSESHRRGRSRFTALSNLSRDIHLRALADIDDRTRFYARKGVGAFMSDRTSVTERAALWRIEQREELMRKAARPNNKGGV